MSRAIHTIFFILLCAILLVGALRMENSTRFIVVDVNDSNFNVEVMTSSVPVFVLVTPSSGCAQSSCYFHDRQVRRAARGFAGRCKFVRLNPDTNPQSRALLGIAAGATTSDVIVQVKNGQVRVIATVPQSAEDAGLRQSIESGIARAVP